MMISVNINFTLTRKSNKAFATYVIQLLVFHH